MTGTIKCIKPTGFGFITPGEGKDVFFHATKLRHGYNFADLTVGDQVMFDVEENAKGLSAIDVCPIS
jgi:CspA family cold shock protein